MALTKVKNQIYPIKYTHSRRKNSLINAFPMGMTANQNSNSFAHDLNLVHRFRFQRLFAS